MNTTVYNEWLQKANDGTVSDGENPIFILSDTHLGLLVDIASGNLDMVALAKIELQNRGFDINGNWVGFKKIKSC